MRQVIFNEDLRETEVHLPGLYERLQNISIQSAAELLRDRAQFTETPCPACASSNRESAFDKHGYSYQLCGECWTLYVSPRPTSAQMDWYLTQSPAAAFRRGEEYRQATEQRSRERAAQNAAWIGSLRSSSSASEVAAN